MIFKKLKEDFNLFGEFLDTPNENIKINKARLQIKEIIEIMPFPMLATLLIYAYGGLMNFGKTQETAFLISGTIFILIIWFIIQIHYRKKREN